MNFLLSISRAIDSTQERFGKALSWLILAAVLVSSINAIIRFTFNISSNAWLELQWYLFSAVFLLGAGYTFLQNAHVRIDVLAGKLSMRTRMYIDIAGIIVFLLPLCWFMIQFAWPVVVGAYVSGEMSSNAGGLIRWPVYALVPIGFALLGLQAISELIKRFAFLQGKAPNPLLNGAHDGNEAHDAANAHPHHDDAGEVQK